MNIANALKIEGAMDPPELEWLAEQASRRKVIVEVGCWMGRSTTVLSENTSGVVYAVDTWKGSEEHQEQLRDKPENWLFNEFMKNTCSLGNVFPIRLSSVEAAASLGDGLDMVFIDASHDYESVRADIIAWGPLISSGGILCGHDYGYPPVTKAVQTYIHGVQSSGSIWFKEKP